MDFNNLVTEFNVEDGDDSHLLGRPMSEFMVPEEEKEPIKYGTKIGKCPICKTNDVTAYEKAFQCNGWKSKNELGMKECEFIIWKTIAGKEITEDIAKTLVEVGKTVPIEGFMSKAGKSFSACLEIKDGRAVFNFEMPSIADCPCCGKGVVETSKAYSCSGWKEGCKFAIWKEIAQRQITKEEAVNLINDKEIGPIDGFVSRSGTTFSATLKLAGDKATLVF